MSLMKFVRVRVRDPKIHAWINFPLLTATGFNHAQHSLEPVTIHFVLKIINPDNLPMYTITNNCLKEGTRKAEDDDERQKIYNCKMCERR